MVASGATKEAGMPKVKTSKLKKRTKQKKSQTQKLEQQTDVASSKASLATQGAALGKSQPIPPPLPASPKKSLSNSSDIDKNPAATEKKETTKKSVKKQKKPLKQRNIANQLLRSKGTGVAMKKKAPSEVPKTRPKLDESMNISGNPNSARYLFAKKLDKDVKGTPNQNGYKDTLKSTSFHGSSSTEKKLTKANMQSAHDAVKAAQKSGYDLNKHDVARMQQDGSGENMRKAFNDLANEDNANWKYYKDKNHNEDPKKAAPFAATYTPPKGEGDPITIHYDNNKMIKTIIPGRDCADNTKRFKTNRDPI